MNTTNTLRDRLIVLIGMLLTAFMGLLYLGDKSIWFDEAFSIMISRHLPFLIEMVRYKESHMVLYYFILHLVQMVGTNEWMIRLPSIIFAVGTVPYLYFLAKKIIGPAFAWIPVFLYSTNFFLIYYAQLARGYTLLLLLTTAGTWYFLQAIEKNTRKDWLLYVICSVLSVYTHMYAIFFIASQAVSLLFKLKQFAIIKRFIVANIVTGILIAPFLLSSVLVHHPYEWLAQPSITGFIGTLIVLSGENIMTLLIFFASLFYIQKYILSRSLKNSEGYHLFVLLILIVFPTCIAFLLSFIVKPIFQSIYFIYCLPSFLLLLTFGIARIQSKIIVLALIGIMMLGNIGRLYFWYSNSPHGYIVIDNNVENWKDATSYILKNKQYTDAVIHYGYFMKLPFEYYLEEYGKKNAVPIVELTHKEYPLGGGGRLPDPEVSILQSLPNQYNRIWLVLSNDEPDILGRYSQKKIILSELEKNYTLIEEVDFTRIRILLFGATVQ